jgi:hypothetical protein
VRRVPTSRTVRLAGIAALAVALWGCSASVHVGTSNPTLPRAQVESQTASELAAKLNQPAPTVTCPGDLEAKVGTKMDCTLVAQGDTTRLPVHLTVDSITGTTAHWNIDVGTGPLPGKDTFCADNAKLDKLTASVTTGTDLIGVFKDNVSVIDDFATNAPADIHADANTLATAAHTAISANDASGFTNPSVAAAGAHVDAYCGQNPDGSPATTTTAP